jgi:hypothetical protein
VLTRLRFNELTVRGPDGGKVVLLKRPPPKRPVGRPRSAATVRKAKAATAIRNYRLLCKRLGWRYDRNETIDQAAKYFSIDADALTRWMHRSRQPRRKK